MSLSPFYDPKTGETFTPSWVSPSHIMLRSNSYILLAECCIDNTFVVIDMLWGDGNVDMPIMAFHLWSSKRTIPIPMQTKHMLSNWGWVADDTEYGITDVYINPSRGVRFVDVDGYMTYAYIHDGEYQTYLSMSGEIKYPTYKILSEKLGFPS